MLYCVTASSAEGTVESMDSEDRHLLSLGLCLLICEMGMRIIVPSAAGC